MACSNLIAQRIFRRTKVSFMKTIFFGEIGSCVSNSELVWLAVVSTLGMSS